MQSAVLRWDFGDAPLVLFRCVFCAVHSAMECFSKRVFWDVLVVCEELFWCSPQCYGGILVMRPCSCFGVFFAAVHSATEIFFYGAF